MYKIANLQIFMILAIMYFMKRKYLTPEWEQLTETIVSLTDWTKRDLNKDNDLMYVEPDWASLINEILDITGWTIRLLSEKLNIEYTRVWKMINKGEGTSYVKGKRIVELHKRLTNGKRKAA